jgi:hyperosmotically inducible periplasmic protein
MKTTNEYKQYILADRVLVIACLFAVLGLAGCQQEGTAEKAGQKIDRVVENAGQKIEQATDKANQNIAAAKESLNQKADKAGAYINESTDASKGALEKAGKKLEGAKESVIDKAQSAGAYIDDSVITATVKAAILNDSTLKASQTQIAVTTEKGVVKLSGTVDSEQSIGRAIEVANSQKNVKSVETDLIVNASSPRKY